MGESKNSPLCDMFCRERRITMADARNYEQYRREVLDNLGVEYYDEDITEFSRWRLKVFEGLADLFGEENIIQAIENWLDEHPEATTTVEDGAVTIPKLGDDVINKIENVPVPLASGTKVGGIKIGAAGAPPRPSARLTVNWTPSYSNVSDVKFPLIRDDDTISPYLIPDATHTVKGAMSAEDKTKLDILAEGYDFETTLTPAINSNGTSSQLYNIVPKDLTTITLKDALKISAYLYITGTDYEEAIPLIVTACRSNTGVSYTLAVKCIISSPQGTGDTVSGKLHIVAPFEIDSVTVTM